MQLNIEYLPVDSLTPCLEKDPKYVDIIIDRWEEFTGQKAELLNGL